MSVQNINGQLYNSYGYLDWLLGSGMNNMNPQSLKTLINAGIYSPASNPAAAANNPSNLSNPSGGMNSNPFGAAMSGTAHGTLQPYINRMTQNASNALYGGLLNYSPQSMVAGNAGGTPQNSTVPNFNIPGLLNSNFGQRAWMR